MEHQVKYIISKLQAMPENKMTKEILIPFLESLGYFKVEFYGGVNEKGKDILCWEFDKFDEIKLTVAQVKHFKFTNTASDSKSFQTIFNQLIACFTKQLPFGDKSVHLPENAILISTYEIDTKTLETRLSEHPSLIEKKVTIIDGIKLASLLKKKKPELVNKIMGVEVGIYSSIELTLNNEILLKALGYFEKKAIKNIYTDIDFSLGKLTTQLFFNSDFKPKVNKITFESKDWNSFKINCAAIENEFELDFLNKTIQECEEKNSHLIEEHSNWKNILEKLNAELDSYQNEQDILTKNHSDLEKKIEYIRKKGGTKIINEQEKELQQIINNIKNIDKKLTKVLGKIKEHKSNEVIPRFQITINGKMLASKIEGKRNWVEQRVAEYNKEVPSIEEIKNFIQRCKNIVDSAKIIFSDTYFFSCIINYKKKLIRTNFEATRLKLPIEKVFDTGLNISILGEAGAGKTTCLQMYTINRQKDTSKLYVYLPLSRVIQNWIKCDKLIFENNKSKLIEVGIAKYLNNNAVSITIEEFRFLLNSKKIVLLLDGIDEAIKIAPWLIKEINSLTERYKDNVQIITTSRMSGSYIDEISFFNITLLPFTNEQRNYFIKSWFGSRRKDIVAKITRHLNKSKAISELVKNPLLTTILCVLAENELPLPYSEIRLYDERLKLLTGYYDNVKNIATRISTPPHVLEMLARKLAFHLHSNSIREEDLFVLHNISIKLMLNKMSINDSKRALNELIDPCNILVPMSDDGKFGFGHIRYQEHLTAKELINNRGINVFQYFRHSWWRSVLLLFARMNDDLTWLIQELGQKKQMTTSKELLNSLIKTRPENERKKLKSFINRYLMLEGWDQDFNEEL